jgi:L-fuconolactonase
MFGSDWPVCLLAAEYDRVFDAIQQIVGLDDQVFGETARRVYSLPET